MKYWANRKNHADKREFRSPEQPLHLWRAYCVLTMTIPYASGEFWTTQLQSPSFMLAANGCRAQHEDKRLHGPEILFSYMCSCRDTACTNWEPWQSALNQKATLQLLSSCNLSRTWQGGWMQRSRPCSLPESWAWAVLEIWSWCNRHKGACDGWFLLSVWELKGESLGRPVSELLDWVSWR